MLHKKFFKIAVLIFLAAGCNTSNHEKNDNSDEAIVLKGLDGKAYTMPMVSAETQAVLDSNIWVAQQNFDKEKSIDNYVWLGRRLAYASRYREAIAIFTQGLETHENAVKLLRHRGHRYITLRMFDSAVADLSKAAFLLETKPIPRETEPDGIANATNTPLSSTQFNVYYHLALAYYLQGDFEQAIRAYNICMKWSDNDDLRIATTDWLYMTLMRLQKKQEAMALLSNLPDTLTIIENDSYWKRLQFYKGRIPIDSLIVADSTLPDYHLNIATQGYGAANWYIYNGDTVKGMALINKILNGKNFAAFGFIAAEADAVRLRNK